MDERKRERLIARSALVLVLLLVGALIWRPDGAGLMSRVELFIDAFRAEFTRITARVELPTPRAERTPPPAPSGMPAPPDDPPPVVLDLPPAVRPPVVSLPEAAASANIPNPLPPGAGGHPPPVTPSPKRDAVTANAPAPPPPTAKDAVTLNEPSPAQPTPEERERAAALARMVPPASAGSAPATQVDALMLDRTMERGIALFNATDKEPDRHEGARLVYLTAALGYGPARALIARSYPRSQAVRTVTPPADAVRFALDAFAVGGSYSKNPEHVVTSLMVYLLEQRQEDALAHAVIEVMRDDPRLQVNTALELMFDALNLARGACPAIGRLVKVPVAVGASECTPSLKAQALTYAKQAGATGRDAELRRKAAAELDEVAVNYR